jgi:hypothetical protein
MSEPSSDAIHARSPPDNPDDLAATDLNNYHTVLWALKFSNSVERCKVRDWRQTTLQHFPWVPRACPGLS